MAGNLEKWLASRYTAERQRKYERGERKIKNIHTLWPGLFLPHTASALVTAHANEIVIARTDVNAQDKPQDLC